ncbi:MAG: septation regulator SpoVG [Culicoidibacterales bacterium]
MNITNVHVRLIQKEGRVRAIAAVTLSESFVVHDIRVIEGNEGLFVAMPSRRLQNGEFRDIAHPINAETRKSFEVAILAQYEIAVTEAENAAQTEVAGDATVAEEEAEVTEEEAEVITEETE